MLVLGDDVGAVLAGLYVWIPIGNGFRFGRRYLHFAQTLALLCLAAILVVSPYWRAHFTVGLAFVIAVIAIPWYVSLLIARLQAAPPDRGGAPAAEPRARRAVRHEAGRAGQAARIPFPGAAARLNGAFAARAELNTPSQNCCREGEVAERGDATVCNAVHVGSNPTFASIISGHPPGGRTGLRTVFVR